jgi:hypothetical protein
VTNTRTRLGARSARTVTTRPKATPGKVATPSTAGSKRDRPISVVPSPARAGSSLLTPHAPFLAVVLLLAVAGLIGLVLLNTAVNENAFRLHDLETKQDSLDQEEQRLDSAKARAESPAHLNDLAQKMGLVPAGQPAFVDVPKGKVIGTPTPARAPTPSPSPSSKSTTSPAPGGTSTRSPTAPGTSESSGSASPSPGR